MSLTLQHTYLETLRISRAEIMRLSVRLAEKKRDILAHFSRGDRVYHAYAPLYLPYDKSGCDTAEKVVQMLGKPKLLILIGIGGSSLGVEALADALLLSGQLFVLDTPSPERLSLLLARLAKEKLTKKDIVVAVVSKSGKTQEIITHLDVTLPLLEHQLGALGDRVVAVSNAGTPLEMRAESAGWKFFAMPSAVGGRYSVMSVAWLIPLALLGVDIRAFLAGGEMALTLSSKSPVLHNPASILAGVEYLFHQKGIHHEVNFFFAPELEILGKWHRQLIAESTGKHALGKRSGMISSVAVGTTDLHSIQQYIIDGPRDLLLLLTNVESLREHTPESKVFAHFRASVMRGVAKAYQEAGVPFMTLSIPRVDEKNLGAYMATRMEETILFAHLLGVDPFDQPGVESYKKHTRV